MSNGEESWDENVPDDSSTLRLIRQDVDALKQAAVEHRVRLENGSNVFRGYDQRIRSVEERTTPKPPSVYKIIGITLTVVFTGAVALWALANMLRDRPTLDQIEKIIKAHDDGGHHTVREDVRAVQVEQGAQRALIENVQVEQKNQGAKLDQLLERTPRNRRDP